MLTLLTFTFSWSNEVTFEPRLEMETMLKGVQAADDLLSLYERVLDRAVPWKEFNDISTCELDKFRPDYSAESAHLVCEIRTLVENGIENYNIASMHVYEWSQLSIPLLEAYMGLFHLHTQENAYAQKFILMKLLDDGISKSSASQGYLHKSSDNFREAFIKLVSLNSRFDVEFREKSEFIQNKMRDIQSGRTGRELFGIEDVKETFKKEGEGKFVSHLIESLIPIQTYFVELREKVSSFINNLLIYSVTESAITVFFFAYLIG